MAPELYDSFARGFTAEWNREQKARCAEQDGKRGELKRLIPTAAAHDTFAHSRVAMDVIVSGAAIKAFHAAQQASTMASYVS